MLRLSVTVEGKEWVFGFPQDEVVVGAERANGLVLAHVSVASKHARFSRRKDGVMVEPLDRAKPLVVNAMPRGGRLMVGEADVIDIGAYRLALLERDPPGRVEQAFLDAITSAPSDDMPRAVYGDWLEENGRLDDARFLRAQIDIRGLEASDPRFAELSRTILQLGPKMSLAWRRVVARPAIENCGARFELRCPKTWDELAKTDDENERWCNSCSKPVIYASTIDRARRLAIAGQCVAIDAAVPRRSGDLFPPAPRLMGAIAPPPRS